MPGNGVQSTSNSTVNERNPALPGFRTLQVRNSIVSGLMSTRITAQHSLLSSASRRGIRV
jgi:hypothetical protein